MTFLYDFLTIIKFSFGKILPSLWGSVNHLRIKNCCTARFFIVPAQQSVCSLFCYSIRVFDTFITTYFPSTIVFKPFMAYFFVKFFKFIRACYGIIKIKRCFLCM